MAEWQAVTAAGVPGLVLRPAVASDAALILRFIIELAVYEKEPDAVVTDEAGIAASLFGPGSTSHALVAELDGAPVGYAVWFASYSTWLGRNGLYLEDLYVTPAQRGQGVGKAILRHLAGLAVAAGCGRMEWSVLDWNAPAIAFYESVGARPQSEWTVYRLTGDALSDFAAGR